MMDKEVLESKVRQLLDLQRELDTLSALVDTLKTDIKNEMTERGEYVLSGEDWEITWNSVSSNRFDQSWFKKENPGIFSKYMVISESRRFLLKDKRFDN